MKPKIPLLSLIAVVLLMLTSVVALGPEMGTSHAHGSIFGSIGLPNQIAHFDGGDPTFKLGKRFSYDPDVPTGWKPAIEAAATHLRDQTFVESFDEDSSRGEVLVAVGFWPRGVTIWGNCDEDSVDGGTYACAYASERGRPGIDLTVYSGVNNDLAGGTIIFDESDVFDANGNIRPKWNAVAADGSTLLQRVSAHELAHTLGFHDHIAGGNLLDGGAPRYTLSDEDRWNLNRLYLDTNEGRAACETDINLGDAKYRNAAGFALPFSLLSNSLRVCPATALPGYGKYFDLEHDGSRPFWLTVERNLRWTP